MKSRLSRLSFSAAVQVVCASILLLGVAAAWGRLARGSTLAAVHLLRGEVLTAPSWRQHVKVGSQDAVVFTETQVRNVGGRPVTIVGAETYCRCAGAVGLPIVISPGELKTITWWIDPRKSSASGIDGRLMLDTPAVPAIFHFELDRAPDSGAGG